MNGRLCQRQINTSCEAYITHCTINQKIGSVTFHRIVVKSPRCKYSSATLGIAAGMKEGDVPNLQYRRKCHNVLAQKGMFGRITKKG